MSKQHRVMRNDLLETAKNIFGDIVKAVYMDIDIFNDSEENISYYLNNTFIKTKNILFSNLFDHVAIGIIIEFTNGKFVSFSSSESGNIRATKEKEVTIV